MVSKAARAPPAIRLARFLQIAYFNRRVQNVKRHATESSNQNFPTHICVAKRA